MISYEQAISNLMVCETLAPDVKSYSIPLKESYIQALWNHYATIKSFETTAGEVVEVLDPGTWNDEAGPDFLRAKITIAGERIEGDVELHLVASDWYAHQHDDNPAYDSVILHVVWSESDRTPDIPTLCLRNQISDTHIQEIKRLDWMNYPDGLKYPPCALAPFLSLKSDKVLCDFFMAAGRIRFYDKLQAFKKSIIKWGRAEALWQGLADALGYKNNRQPFIELAQRLPWSKLSALSTKEREALIWGESGFLPLGLQETDLLVDLKPYVKSLWKLWWKDRGKEDSNPIAWSHRGRPQNSPERRLMLFCQFCERFDLLLNPSSDVEKLKSLLEFKPSDWDGVYSFKKQLKSPAKLLGESRQAEIITNILLPYYAAIDSAHEADYLVEFLNYRKLPPNHLIKEAVNRFLIPPARAKLIIKENGTQQGLILLVNMLRSGYNFHDQALIQQLLK